MDLAVLHSEVFSNILTKTWKRWSQMHSNRIIGHEAGLVRMHREQLGLLACRNEVTEHATLQGRSEQETVDGIGHMRLNSIRKAQTNTRLSL